MSEMSNRWGWFIGIAIASVFSDCTNYANAQITPDGTLPNNSIVTPNGSTLNITGGTQAGSNLFHSFQQFSVPANSTAFFDNAADIQNIISRVTGGSVSNIDGLIRANPTANLFLINPSGIIFGRNASLNIGGSFVASTANAVAFGNQGIFSANNPNTPELLRVNPSALLFNQIRAASIENNSTATGLSVPDGKSLLLVGGDINMNGGGLFAFGGRIELGGLAGAGTVRLNGNGNNLSLSFPDSVERSDVSLSNSALVYVAAGDGGSIAVNARNLKMTEESRLVAGIRRGLGSDNSKTGNIEVNATETTNLNTGSYIANNVLAEANGQGGDVSISASTLQVEGGAQVGAGTFGRGKGGSLRVDAQDIQVIGRSIDNRFASGLFASAQPNSTGDAGNLTINARELLVRDGAQVGTGTFGAGKGGILTVNATKGVELIGRSANNWFPSGLFTQTEQGTGAAGDMTINTATLLARDGAGVSTGTRGAGRGGNLTVNATQSVQIIGVASANGRFTSALTTQSNLGATGAAGDMTINTRELLVKDGAQVGTSTFGTGQGGNLTVNTTQRVELIGRSADGLASSGLFTQADTTGETGKAGDMTINTATLLVQDGAVASTSTFGAGKGGNLTVNATQGVELIGRSADGLVSSALVSQVGLDGTGAAGDLIIYTPELLIRNGAGVGVNSTGTGSAGNLNINARSIRLDNQGVLSSQSTLGSGGNINLQVGSLLLLRRGSRISTTAGTAQQLGDGGNITINAPNGFIIAVPNENSDITANAFTGKGGRVNIKAFGIYGIQPRQIPTSLSDITASSEFGVNGIVELNTPDIDPNSGLVNLPTIAVDTEVAQSCAAGGTLAQSKFIITGRGGLPPNPGEALNTDAVQVDLVTLKPNSDASGGLRLRRISPYFTSKTTTPAPERIIEATSLVLNEKGEVVLTANLPTTPHSPWLNSTSC